MQKGVKILDMKDRVGTEGVPTGRVISTNGYKLMPIPFMTQQFHF